jgi:hypothetical protein
MTHDTARLRASVFRGAARLALLSFLAACGGDDDDAPGADASTDSDAGADAATGPDGSVARTTGFVANPAGTIHLMEGYAGQFQDQYRTGAYLLDGAIQPHATLVDSAGPCEIWSQQPRPALCDPPCEEGYCVADGECEPLPGPVTAGEITVTGLRDELRFVPGEFGYVAEPKLPFEEDIFEDGAAIEVSAPGDEVAGFDLSATGVVPLVHDLDLEFDVTLVIEDGVDEVVRWIPESSGSVQIALQVGWHGAPYEALLLCEAEDEAGELVIPGSLIERFPDREDPTGEAHSHWIARFNRDVVDSPGGPIELFVGSRVLILQIEHRR